MISRRLFLKTAGAILVGSQSSLRGGAALNPVRYIDVAGSAGISFQHDNAASAEKYLIETMGSGCGWIDYDQNGLLDLYLVNGARPRLYTPRTRSGALSTATMEMEPLLMSRKAGVGAEGLFGMGMAVGDYDNDGFPDLLVLGYGRCILYHNNGDGTFTDVTRKAGVENMGRGARVQHGLITTTMAVLDL